MNKLFFYEKELWNNNGEIDEISVLEAFAESLVTIRNHLEISTIRLSKETGIPQPTISAYENKTRMPSIWNALKLATFFDMTIDDFILCGTGTYPIEIDELYDNKHKK